MQRLVNLSRVFSFQDLNCSTSADCKDGKMFCRNYTKTVRKCTCKTGFVQHYHEDSGLSQCLGNNCLGN